MLGAYLIRGLAGSARAIVLGLRRDLFDHLTSLSLRYFSRAARGLDHRAPDERRRRALGRALEGLPTLVANRLIALPAAIVGAVRRSTGGSALVALVSCRRRSSLTRWFQVRSQAASSRCGTGSRR